MSEDKKIMSIVLEDGSVEEVEVLVSFEFKDTGKQYMVYTKNETDEKGNITVYVASVTESEEEIKLGSIDTDEEWNRIKEVLKKLSKDDEEE